MDFRLTEQERVRLLHHQKRERRKKVATSIRRYQAITILPMLDAGTSFEQVATAFGIDDFRSPIKQFFKFTEDHAARPKPLLAPNAHIEKVTNQILGTHQLLTTNY